MHISNGAALWLLAAALVLMEPGSVVVYGADNGNQAITYKPPPTKSENDFQNDRIECAYAAKPWSVQAFTNCMVAHGNIVQVGQPQPPANRTPPPPQDRPQPGPIGGGDWAWNRMMTWCPSSGISEVCRTEMSKSVAIDYYKAIRSHVVPSNRVGEIRSRYAYACNQYPGLALPTARFGNPLGDPRDWVGPVCPPEKAEEKDVPKKTEEPVTTASRRNYNQTPRAAPPAPAPKQDSAPSWFACHHVLGAMGGMMGCAPW